MNFADYKHKDLIIQEKAHISIEVLPIDNFFLVYGAWRLPIRNMRKKLKIIEQEQM